MAKPCQICGNERNYKLSSSEEQNRIKESLSRLDSLTEDNIQLRANCEDIFFSEEKQALNSLKARYIELLSRREMLTKRIFEQRERDRKGAEVQRELEEFVVGLQGRVRTAEQELSCSTTIADGLTDVLRDQSQELYVRRMQGAISIIRMMHLKAHPPPRQAQNDGPGQALALSGCSSILSMPLPNSGNFSGVPVDAVTTAVSHIAHLVDALSGILNVVLPHPLYPFEAADCLVSAQHDLWARAQVRGSCYSLAPATLMNDRTNFRDFDWATLHELSSCQPEHTGGCGDATTGTSAPQSGMKAGPQGGPTFQYELPVVLKAKDGERRGAEYSLNPNFPTALVLLQADIVALCLRAGLRAEDLWPPEAMLFNLSLLSRHCESIVHRYASSLPPPGATAMPAMYSVDAPMEVSRALDDLTLSALKDRYGSAARRSQAEYADAARGAGDVFEAEFRPEESGLERESEWDVVTIQGVV